jgi:hypothetical protein
MIMRATTFPVYRHEMGAAGTFTSRYRYCKLVEIDGEEVPLFSDHDTAGWWKRAEEQFRASKRNNPPESLDAEGEPRGQCVAFFTDPATHHSAECRTTTGDERDPECKNCQWRRAHGWEPVFEW